MVMKVLSLVVCRNTTILTGKYSVVLKTVKLHTPTSVSRMVPETYERSRIVVVWSSVFVLDTGTAFEGDLFTLLILPSLNLTMQARLSSFKCLCINLVFNWFPVPVDYELFSSEV